MALDFRAQVAASGTASPGTVTISSFSTGDLMMIAFSTLAAGGAITAPSGWTEKWDNQDGGANVRAGFYYRIKDGSEGSTVTFAVAGTLGRWAAAATAIYTDLPPLSLTAVTAATLTSDAGGNTTISFGSVAPGASGYTGIAAVGYRATTNSVTPTIATVPTGWTQRAVADSHLASGISPQLAAIFSKANIASGGETPTGGVYSTAGYEENGHVGMLIAETAAAAFVPQITIL